MQVIVKGSNVRFLTELHVRHSVELVQVEHE